MIREFFVRRPNLATVGAFLLLLCGGLCARYLRQADYSELTPPIVTVTANYPGASPQVVADTVATPIEDQVNGVENVYFFDSLCRDTGAYSLTITFLPGTDSDINVVNVQNAVKQAEPRLPSEVIQSGVTVAKGSSDVVIRLAFSTDGTKMSFLELVNAVGYDIKNAIQRVEGVTQVSVADHGGYAMRIWLDALKMNALGIGVEDVKAAIAGQNIQPAAGFVGDSFSSKYLSYKINVRGRLVRPDEFAAIVVRTDSRTEARVLLGDIARCELGTSDYATEDYANGRLTVMLGVSADAKSNLMAISDRCKAAVAEWMKRMPEGVSCEVQCDPTEYTRAILGNIAGASLAAVLLALAVVLLFLGWRMMAVATVTWMLSIAGTAIFLSLAGYSLDVFSLLGVLFALGAVLVNGIGLFSTGFLLVSVVLAVAVYAPLSLHGGMVGMMYVRFAGTLCAAVAVSALVSATLSSSLAVRFRLRPAGGGIWNPLNGLCVRHPVLSCLAFISLGAALFLPANRIRKAFLPNEDRGYFTVECELPEGSSLVRTQEVAQRVLAALKDVPGVSVLTVGPGSTNLGKPGENHAAINLRLAPYAERLEKGLTIESIIADVERRLKPISVAEFTQMYLPPINGLGGFGGVVAYACAIGAVDTVEQAADIEDYADKLRALPQVKSVGTTLSASAPQLFFAADRDKAQALGVSPAAIFSTMQNQLASFYVNDFNFAGGAHQVLVQNDVEARRSLEDALDIRFPGRDGAMVPIRSIGHFEYVLGPRVIPRYNKMSSAGLVITPAEGVTSLEIVDLVTRNPPDASKYVLNWSAMTREECATRGKLTTIVLWSILLALLVLVIYFENWLLPFAVLLPSALAVGGGALGLWLCGEPLTLYAQLALLLMLEFPLRQSLLVVRKSERVRGEGLPLEEAVRAGLLAARPSSVASTGFLLAALSLFLLRGVGGATLRPVGIVVSFGLAFALLFGNAFSASLYVLARRKKTEERKQRD